MNLARWVIAGALLILMFSSIVFAERAIEILGVVSSQAATHNRTVLPFSYTEGVKTYIRMVGTFLIPQASGAAEIRRRDGRTEIKLKMANLVYPQNLGAFHTIYVLLALTPDGEATRLAWIPMSGEFSIEAATSHQTFALIITAEPHADVRLPSPVVLAEKRKDTMPSPEAMKILISGAGIAGLTLSFWLRLDGHDLTVVEKAPSLRDEGYMIDFFGSGYNVSGRMILLGELEKIHYPISRLAFVDANGREGDPEFILSHVCLNQLHQVAERIACQSDDHDPDSAGYLA
jgi:hypothetical protein